MEEHLFPCAGERGDTLELRGIILRFANIEINSNKPMVFSVVFNYMLINHNGLIKKSFGHQCYFDYSLVLLQIIVWKS